MYEGFWLEIHISPACDCVSRTRSLMGWKVYWATAIFNDSQENYTETRNLRSLL